MNMGKLTQVLGAVVDVEFSDGGLPGFPRDPVARLPAGQQGSMCRQ